MSEPPHPQPPIGPHLKVLSSQPSLRGSASSASLRSSNTPAIASNRPANIRIPSPLASMPPSLESPPGNSNVRVVVRARAFLQREIEKGAVNLIEMNPQTQETHLNPPPDRRAKGCERKSFTFDNSFCSIDPSASNYASQEDIYNSLGQEFLDHNFQGYHTCIFAYGQTGAGKSYSMMGTPQQPGLIPRTCKDLFERIDANMNPNVTYTVRVSYFEVYNEHVRDLLVPRRDEPYYLKVRESPTDGPYIKDLTEVPVRGITEVLKWMKLGDKSRTVASTNMNDTSSRSHAVFTLMLKQIECHDGDETTERLARIRLVDLAGSERANSTGATGARLREGSNINKSLTTLGRVIAALAEDSLTKKPRRRDVIPYRDSILTYLLKDSLGGNSKTAMIACISPTDYDETLSTLRYADQAKKIRTTARINQDQVSQAERDKQILDMQETIRKLQMEVGEQGERGGGHREQLELYQAEVKRMQEKMEEARAVAESKIRSLTMKNETLTLHLRLAIDSLKNPIPAVYGEDDSTDEDSEPTPRSEMELQLEGLLNELGMFRKKMSGHRKEFLGDGMGMRGGLGMGMGEIGEEEEEEEGEEGGLNEEELEAELEGDSYSVYSGYGKHE